MMGRGLEQRAECLPNLDPGQNAPSLCMQGTCTSHTYHLMTRLRRVHRIVCEAPLVELCSRTIVKRYNCISMILCDIATVRGPRV